MKYSIEELEKFKRMFEELLVEKESEIRNLALSKWMERKEPSTPDCFLYAIENKINELVYNESEREKAKLTED